MVFQLCLPVTLCMGDTVTLVFFSIVAYLRHAIFKGEGSSMSPDCVPCLGLLRVSASGTIKRNCFILNCFFILFLGV